MYFSKLKWPVVFTIHQSDEYYENKNDFSFNVYNIGHWKLISKDAIQETALIFKKEQHIRKIASLEKNHFGIIVSSSSEIEVAAKYANFLYLPGELCRQSDFLTECVNTKLPLIIEKGCFLTPNELQHLLNKVSEADVVFVDCGYSLGYSDVVLDPRGLFTMRQSGKIFGIHLSDLLSPEGCLYTNRPQWLNHKSFIEAFMVAGKSLGSSFYVIKSYGHAALSAQEVSKWF